jgi:hypothetical protein
MKISKQMRIVLIAVVVLGIGGVAAKTLLLKSSAPVNLSVPPAVHHPVHHAAAAQAGGSKTHAAAAPRVQLDPDLPAALRVALLHHGVVITVLYARHAPGDAKAVVEAQQGAQMAHVGFAALDVSNEAVATAVALKMPGSSDPSVAVVTRPGNVTLLLPGYIDSQVVAQAARDAS